MKFNQYLNEGINDIGIFKAVFFAGSPGSGKSYTISKINSGKIEPRIVNTDKVYPLFKDNWDNWDIIKSSVKNITMNQLSGYINSMLPLLIDSTSNKIESLVRRQGLLKSLGYDCDMLIYINTPLEVSLNRAKNRDRNVPENIIINIYNKNKELIPFYKSQFKFFIEIKNDVGELNNEIINEIYKKCSLYYMNSIKNPIGFDNINKLKNSGEKYLIPSIYSKEYIDKIISIWYKN